MSKQEKQLENLTSLVLSCLKSGNTIGMITVILKTFELIKCSWLVAWSPFIIGWGIWLLYLIILLIIGLLLFIAKDEKPKKINKIENNELEIAVNRLRKKRKGQNY